MTASSPRPAGPDTTGGELRDDEWWTRLFLASSEAIDSVPYAAGPEYPVPHAAAFRSAVEPALRDLIAERDKLAAQVQAVEGLLPRIEGVIEFDMAGERYDAVMSVQQVLEHLRRALGTPTTGGGE